MSTADVANGLVGLCRQGQFMEAIETYGLQVDGPFVGDLQFAVRFHMDVTPKMTGQRVSMVEVGVYTVEDGKIVREEFYYNAP